MLLLEAGGWDRDPWIHIPLGWGKILKERLHDWMYFSGPEEHADGRQVECARGKVVGGSSSTNAMAFVRGNRGDYDRWAEAGLTGWSYAHALPYFRKLERWEGGANAYRGGDGPLNTQFCRYEDPLLGAYAEAGRTRRLCLDGRLQRRPAGGLRPAADDHPQRPPPQRRHRLSAPGAEAAKPDGRRSKALATRILFEGSRAVGVEYRAGRRRRVSGARRAGGDPRRRRHQLAAASDAFRRRRPGGAPPPRHSGEGSLCRASARTCRTMPR